MSEPVDAAEAPRPPERHRRRARLPPARGRCSTSCSPASWTSSTLTPPRSCCSRTTAARWSRGRPRASRRRSSGGVRMPVRQGFAGRIAATAQPVLHRRTSTTRRSSTRFCVEKGLKSLLGVPLMIEGDVIGVLHVGSLRPPRVRRRRRGAAAARRRPGGAGDQRTAGRAGARPRGRAPAQPDAAAARASRRDPRGALPAGGRGEARAATGTTPSCCRAGRSAWPSATSPARASTPPR